MKFCVFLDNGHGENTKGKCSPCKSLYEWKYCREIVKRIKEQLDILNIECFEVTPEDTDISLTKRVNRINNKYSELKKLGYKCILISVHVNAAMSDGKWHNASGFTVWVSKNSSKNSKQLAQIIYNEAKNVDLKGNRWIPECLYFQENYTILYKSLCPAILTENLFQDNYNDVKYLLSEKGKETVVKIHVNAILKYINYIS